MGEKIPIEIYLRDLLGTKEIMKLTESWPINVDQILKYTINYFRDLGILTVESKHHELMIRSRTFKFLENSSELKELIDKTRRQIAIQESRRANDP